MQIHKRYLKQADEIPINRLKEKGKKLSEIRFRAILLEDDDTIRSVINDILTARGYETFSFSSPAICPLQLTRECRCNEGQQCIDLIISDLDMPAVTGLQFIENQKKKKCKCQHIALMSGFLTEQDKLRAEALGCKIFLKPFSLDELHKWLDEVESQINPNRKLADWFLNPDDSTQSEF